MKQIMLVETNLSTAGRDVFHIYTATDDADSRKIAETLFDDDGTGWDTLRATPWNVKCIASSEYGDIRPKKFNGEVFYENDFVRT